MRHSKDIAEGARNLLVNCADLRSDETLLIVCEDPNLGWYDNETAQAVANEARTLGLTPTLLDVGAPENSRNSNVTKAIEAHTCTIFLSRMGDQDRFADPMPGKKIVMSYARDRAELASTYGRANHRAFLQLKAAVNEILLSGETVHITCPLGTDISGNISKTEKEGPGDVSVRRFPMGVPQPLDASQMSGQVALARYLTPTGSNTYDPASLEIDSTVIAEVSMGRVKDLQGKPKDIGRIRRHYQMVASLFAIDGDVVHSFHAGIHPGSAYAKDVAEDPDRWSNSAFTNPRVLHFHTCGDYPPGEICWMVIDHTLTIDGKALWENGRLCVNAFDETASCLDDWPELRPLFASPSNAIGIFN
jgi:hypothetical protein